MFVQVCTRRPGNKGARQRDQNKVAGKSKIISPKKRKCIAHHQKNRAQAHAHERSKAVREQPRWNFSETENNVINALDPKNFSVAQPKMPLIFVKNRDPEI